MKTNLKFDPFGKAYRFIESSEEKLSIEIVRAVKDAVSDGVELLIEGHDRFSVSTAIRIRHALEEFEPLMNVAQDDELKVWINGELTATSTSWTGGALTTNPHDISLEKGDNLFLVKVSEEGGGDYLNVNFDAENLEFDADVKKFGYSVSPADKLATNWGNIKARR